MLEIRNLSVAYGGLHALTDVSLTVQAGQFVTVVGPNGAGKSTLFKTICGIVPPVAGAIRFEGADLLALPRRSARAHLGIAHVPEGRQVFRTLTVRENLEMGAYTEAGTQQWRADDRAHPHAVPDPARSGPGSLPARCRAASSRCWRSAAAWRPRRGC